MFARIQLAALVFASACMINATPLITRDPVCARSYTVVPGDTCDVISATQNVSTFQLATVNKDTVNAACDNLWVGQVLCLGIQGQDCTTVHRIISGDTCEAILANAGITLATLRANNPNVDSGCANIYPDEVLCIASTAVYA